MNRVPNKKLPYRKRWAKRGKTAGETTLVALIVGTVGALWMSLVIAIQAAPFIIAILLLHYLGAF